MTTRKRPNQTLSIASLARAVLLSVVMLPVQMVARASPLDEAIPEMRRYCMDEVCLGMTVDEVYSLPHREFALRRPLDEAKQCLGGSFRPHSAEYTGKAGTKLSVHFVRYPGSGSIRSQYRVWSVTSVLKTTEEELDILRGTLTKRYGLVQSHDERMWWRLSSPFNVVVTAAHRDGSWSTLDLIMQATGPLADWLSSQPECQERQSPSATPMQTKTATLEDSLKGMQAYCMSDVCLGMTADDVEKLAGTKLRMWAAFPDKGSCGRFENSSATFTDRSGQEFNVTFRDYPGPSDSRMRQRVTSVALYVQASEPEFDGLRKTLTSRYALDPSNLWKKANHLDEWSKKASIGSVFVQASYQRKNSLLILGQFDPDYSGRFAEVEECKSRLPKI